MIEGLIVLGAGFGGLAVVMSGVVCWQIRKWG
jgi:hypothetical protein